MHPKFGEFLKLGVAALILACATGASAYQQAKAAAPAESRLTEADTAALPGKSRKSTPQPKSADSYLALHLDIAGTPFLGQIATTAAVAADTCSVGVRRKDRETW